MALLLGIDTGGTYTDAVLLSSENTSKKNGKQKLLAKAKALTTKQDLTIGLGNAIKNVLETSATSATSTTSTAKKIVGCCLSTTLATNALVEQQGAKVALIAIGFSKADMQRAGLAEAIGDNIIIHLQGGHNSQGIEAQPLDIKPLAAQINKLKNHVSGFAIVSYFAVRNESHEIVVREFLQAKIKNCAVTCSHELSQNLNGPKRALTTLLNAKLVPLITGLIDSLKIILQKNKINCPLMIVRGDGSLVSSQFAKTRPIETILSGPAASLIGASFLTNIQDAIICDIGGTTSDVAILKNGMCDIEQQGAQVGEHRTMVEAVAMHTFALGGDIEINLSNKSDSAEITLGTRRVIPISLLASEYKTEVYKQLAGQLESPISSRYDGKFVLTVGAKKNIALPEPQQKLYQQISTSPKLLAGLIENANQAAQLKKLLQQGLIAISSITPSDALHVLAIYKKWDTNAALMAMQLLARRFNRQTAIELSAKTLAQKIKAKVERQTAEIILQTIWQQQGQENYATHNLIQNILENKNNESLVALNLKLQLPLIGLGASSHQYHKACEKLLNCRVIIPEHADVANAIGAAVGKIILRHVILVAEKTNGGFIIIGSDEIYKTKQQAYKFAKQQARARVKKLAKQAGGIEGEIKISISENRATIEARDILVEAKITATIYAKPNYK